MAAPNNQLPDLDLSHLNVKDDDQFSRKLLMLIEGTHGIGVQKSIEKYGYTEQRYYQLKKAFIQEGSSALLNQKRGPKGKRVQKEMVDKQIIRMRFLDPLVNSEVIAQKLSQKGMKISKRSVERTITEYGLQKKTLQIRPSGD
jgi:transposase